MYSRAAYVAIKKETTERVAVTPDVFIPFLSESMATELSGTLSKSIMANRALVYDMIEGQIPAPEGEISLNIEPITIGHFLAAAAGAVTSGNYFPITSPSAAFTVGETITGGTSTETATVAAYSSEGDYMLVTSPSGEFTDGETITGGTSSSTATLTKADNNVYGHESLSPQNSIDDTYTLEIGLDDEVIRYVGVRFHSLANAQGDNIVTSTISVSARAQYRLARVTAAVTAGAGSQTISTKQTTGLAASDSIKVYRRGTGYLDFSAATVKTHTVDAVTDELNFTITNLETSLAVGDLIVLAPQTPSYSSEKELTWSGGSVVRIGASIATALTATPDCIEDYELNLINNIEYRHCADGINQINRYPGKAFTAGFDATGKFMRTYTDVTYMDRLQAIEQTAFQIVHTGGEISTATDFDYMLDIRVADARFQPFETSIAEDDLLNQDMDFQVLDSLTDGYAIKTLLVNTETSY